MSSSLQSMVACRAVLGAGNAATEAGASTYMADLTDGELRSVRAQLLGVQNAIISAAYVAGPAIGGGLSTLLAPQQVLIAVGGATFVCSAGYSQLPDLRPPSPLGGKDEGKEETGKETRRGQQARAGQTGTAQASAVMARYDADQSGGLQLPELR